MLGNIPYGSYTVTVTDLYGSVMPDPGLPDNVVFVGLALDLESQIIAYCNQYQCYIASDYCNSEMTAYMFSSALGITIMNLDASLLLYNGQNFIYEWSINGINLNHNDPLLELEFDHNCANTYYDFYNYCDGSYITVIVTDTQTGCSITETIITSLNWCPVLGTPPPPTTYNTTIYPNPSGSDATFYYQISTTSQEAFNGTVELYSMLGQLIFSNTIQGQTQYTLPYRLVASGAYIIRTTLDDGTVKVDRVIIK